MTSQYTLTQISILNQSGLDISAACAIRANAALNNVPPVRFVPDNPYLGGLWTPRQLDMRRKIEILKYDSLQTQKTNSMTKKQKFAHLVSNVGANYGAYDPTAAVQQYATTNSQYSCPADRLLPTLTTACDVPGPLTVLTYDPNAPLYNYSAQVDNRTYPSDNNSQDIVG